MNSKGSISGRIAIIGMAGRFPGATSVRELWRNLCEGRETISAIESKDLEYAGETEAGRVLARGILEDVDLFDAELFHFLPREAELTDPQQRILLECAWAACEDAGYDPKAYPGKIGVFAGASINTYLLSQLARDPSFLRELTGNYQTGSFPELVGNGHDFLATRISYKLGLRGPAMTVQSACSTSLLAAAQACDSLRLGHADMALAGGVSISFPQRRAVSYQEGGMASPDGHCRPFDAGANGTVFGAGAGIVLLKRLEDAVADGDFIYAVILGHGINNDGAAKAGYAAPSIEGQAAAIVEAHEAAGVDAESIGYIECHGTGTPLGDPIEMAALVKAFGHSTNRKQFCAVSSLKSAVGHLDVAAGVTGLIKTALCLKERKLAPTLHFEKPNPHIDFANSPFFVNASLTGWDGGDAPRRAGVSAFGVGGTNVHMVLEEAPAVELAESTRSSQLLLLSARTGEALAAERDDLGSYLSSHHEICLQDVSYTLAVGRRGFPWRMAMTADGMEGAVAALASARGKRVHATEASQQKVAFLFPGQGAQYPGMGQALYDAEPSYRQTIDQCAETLEPWLRHDIRPLMFSEGEDAANTLRQTRFAQPALFVTEYALARLWMEWGIPPNYCVGHSVGEYVAACLGGVFSLEDALHALALRGEWMQSLAAGGMLAVKMSEAEAEPMLRGELCMAAVNSPSLCVVSGPLDAIAELEKQIAQAGKTSRRLHTSHAFHSAMVEPVIEPLRQFFASVELRPSAIPIFSCVTGTELGDADATSPEYWARHCRRTVRFHPALLSMESRRPAVYLEVGPGTTLATLARQSLRVSPDRLILGSLPGAGSRESALAEMQTSLGALWMHGLEIDFKGYFAHEVRRRVPLPPSRLQRKRYWAECQEVAASSSVKISHPEPVPAIAVPEVPSPQPTESLPIMNTTDLMNKELCSLFEELSGISLDADSHAAGFMELGFDSLFLTQVAQEIQRKFGVKVTFRQMQENLDSISALSEYIIPRLSPEVQARLTPAPVAAPAPVVQAAASPAVAQANSAPVAMSVPFVSSALADGAGIEGLLQQQLKAMSDLMQLQLQVVSGRSGGGAPVPAPALVPVLNAAATAAVAGEAASPAAPKAAEPQPETVELRASSRFSQRPKSASANAAAMDAAQQAFLARLIERYCAKTAGSKRFAQKYRRTLADPRSVAGFRPEWKEMIYSIVCERTSGSKMYDIDGNEYIDLLNGFGPTMFGHEPPFVVEAVKEQLGKSFAIGPHTPLAGEAAELVAELTGSERVTFCNTGSEAVMAAMRAARTVTGRDRVVFFAGDYHGQFDEVLVKGIRRGSEYSSMPIAPGIPRKNVENVTVLEYGEASALAWIENHSNEIAAVIVEPVQSRHPALQPREFLHSLRALTERIGSALVFDEVVTGFRLHPGGAQAYFDVRADMATYGKVAGGGMPIGILGGKAKFMDAFDGGPWQFGDESYPEVGVTFFAGTFVRHPLSIAATCATLRYIREAGIKLYDEMEAKAAGFAARLDSIFAQAGVPVMVERCASVLYFHFPQEVKFGSLFYYLLREKGVFYLEGFPLYLTTQHVEADLERVYRAVEESITEMQEVGLLPGMQARPRSAVEIPLTAPQLEVLLAAQAGDEPNCAFNESFSVYFDGVLKEQALAASWKQLIHRHESLRTNLNVSGDAMRIAPDAEIPIERIDLSALGREEQNERIRALIEAEGKEPFDLQTGPLCRVKLVVKSAEEHQLVVTAHHIVCDGWSTNVLVSEWSQWYSALVNGGTAQLPPLLPYSQYALQAAEPSEEKAEAEAFWRQEFQTVPDLLTLPTDAPRRAQRTFAGATCFETFSAELMKSVRKAGASQGCTLFVTLLSAWQIVLSRLSGEQEPVTLIPAAAQAQFENSSLVGHCVHLLPIRSLVEPEQATAALLRKVKQSVLNAYDHQQITYGSLVHALRITAPAGRLPLSEVQFNLERLGGSATFSGLKAKVKANGKQFVNFDVFLNIVESPEGLRLECDYNTDLYEEGTIRRWIDHYRTVLEAVAADVTAKVSELPMMNSALRDKLLVQLNATARPYPDTSSIPELVRMQGEAHPDAVAVEFYGRKLTRRHLEEQAGRVAAALAARGVGKGSLVGIYVERSLEMVVALLGVLKSGAAYVPLDPLYPRERIEGILQATNMSLLLTLGAHLKELPETGILRLTMEEALKAPAAGGAQVAGPTADSSAYVIFTSGSTGAPKGVEITHRSVVNLLCAAAEEIGFEREDRLLSVTTLTFDIAALELLMPLAFGGTVVVARHQDSADGMRLLELIRASAANILQATPVTWRMLLEAGFSSWAGLKMLVGGESWNRELADRLLSGGGRLWNMYGPTETTIWSSITEILPDGRPLAIGHPLANTQFYVLDERMQPVVPGATGELYIGGDGLARGYYNNAEATAARFLPKPFRTERGARIYRTGDLVRQSVEGEIHFLRRADHQIKLRGFRIELGEIEKAIECCAEVEQAVSMLRENSSGDPALVAYLIPKAKSGFDVEALRKALFAKLPEYMVPAWFMVLEQFPLTANGKVDRKALPLPEWTKVTRAVEVAVPTTKTQVALAQIWSEVLGIAEIGIDDELLSLGADSLRMFQIASRSNRAGMAVSARQLMRLKTIRAIERELEESAGESKTGMGPIRKAPRGKYSEAREIEAVAG